jgi:hypothetical protein
LKEVPSEPESIFAQTGDYQSLGTAFHWPTITKLLLAATILSLLLVRIEVLGSLGVCRDLLISGIGTN